jgi:hypothetical protein
MPNQRSEPKRRIGGYLDKKLFAVIEWMAKAYGMAHDRFGFFMKLALEAMKARERRGVRGRGPGKTICKGSKTGSRVGGP